MQQIISNDEFLKNGFLHLPQSLPKQMLTDLRSFAEQLEQKALDAYNLQQTITRSCISLGLDGITPQLLRYDSIYAEQPELILELLALPVMAAISEALCGPDAIPICADILYKQQNNDSLVLWHQDAVVTKPTSHIIIGIYLDDADLDDGCLRYVRGSQYEIHDISKLAKQHGWDMPDATDCPAKSGDIIVHHAMTMHGSGAKTKAGKRRTIYIEMQTIENLKANTNHSLPWIQLHQQWLQQAKQYKQPMSPDAKTKLQHLAQQLLGNWEQPIASNYGYPPVVTDDYPIAR